MDKRPTNEPGHAHGDSGAGSIPYQTGRGTQRDHFIPNTPNDFLNLARERDYGKSRDVQDRTETDQPLGPIGQATDESHQYDVLGLSADFNTITPGISGPLLAPGASFTFEAGFTPDVWCVYFVNGTIAQVLFAKAGFDALPPCEFCTNAVVGAKSDVLKIPGRGRYLTVRSDVANNVAGLRVVAVAKSNVKDYG